VSRVRVLGVAVAASVTALLSACAGSDAGPPDLLLVSSRDGDYAIYGMDAGGGSQKRLTGDGDGVSVDDVFFQVEPAWSPDGQQIAFASKRRGTFDLYVVDADGSDTRTLTSTPDDDGHPTWSPDGTRLAFERGERGDIYVMEADGTRPRRVTDHPSQEIHPSWSPDGRWIAFVRRTPETRISELWLMRPDGSRLHRLTSLQAGSLSPSWSPDSRRIAFSTNVDGGTRFDVYTVGVNGKGLRRLTRSADDAFEPAWSPDGTTIAYSEGGAIYSKDAAGDPYIEGERLTDTASNDSNPEWRPVPRGG
jgi:Tol biopolymer transport system component